MTKRGPIPADEILTRYGAGPACDTLASYLPEAIAMLIDRVSGDATPEAAHLLIELLLELGCAGTGGGTPVGPPIGTIISSIVEWLGQDGYLPMRGDTYNQADYAYLAAGLPAAWRDDGAGTFTLPDLTGYLIAGAADGSELGDIQPAGPVENRHIEQIVAPIVWREQASGQTSNASRGTVYTRSTTGTATAFTASVGVASPDPISDILPVIRLYYHIKFTL